MPSATTATVEAMFGGIAATAKYARNKERKKKRKVRRN
jgi:hypothetical protein